MKDMPLHHVWRNSTHSHKSELYLYSFWKQYKSKMCWHTVHAQDEVASWWYWCMSNRRVDISHCSSQFTISNHSRPIECSSATTPNQATLLQSWWFYCGLVWICAWHPLWLFNGAAFAVHLTMEWWFRIECHVLVSIATMKARILLSRQVQTVVDPSGNHTTMWSSLWVPTSLLVHTGVPQAKIRCGVKLFRIYTIIVGTFWTSGWL